MTVASPPPDPRAGQTPEILTARGALAVADGLIHGFFTRKGGVSQGLYASLNCGPGSGDDAGHVRRNRARAAAVLGTPPDHLLSLHQTHSAKVVTVERPWKRPWAAGSAPEADALVTATPGLALGVLTADCVPVLLADPHARVIGAAHAGWKGALAGVLEATVEALIALGGRRHRIHAVIGPAISQAHYEVGPEFHAAFCTATPSNQRFFTPGAAGRFWFDLPAYVTARLAALGLASVEDLAQCTYAQPERFFSYRRACHRKDPDYGRNLSAIMLREA